MSRQSTGLSRAEKRGQRSPSTKQLLCTRRDAAEMLRCSVSTVVRLEHEGKLQALRLAARSRDPSRRLHRLREIKAAR